MKRTLIEDISLRMGSEISQRVVELVGTLKMKKTKACQSSSCTIFSPKAVIIPQSNRIPNKQVLPKPPKRLKSLAHC